MLYYVVSTLFVLVCFLLLVVVLLQQGKGGDIASAFGGGGSQTAFGVRQGATVLTKATAVFGALFMVGALALAIIDQRQPGSLLSGVDGPAPPAATPTPAPVEGAAEEAPMDMAEPEAAPATGEPAPPATEPTPQESTTPEAPPED